ncbi:DEAD/DEAH box helicase family protein [Saccharopolyspora sp. WRP15-2]|uniref:DEAD/DEAH box helicase family protein n=1 Tax=Saccharopolyspora oryzae TaxID=2997343 RepID=A0ABT4V4X2_9PSEU|nr:DEAD/DEAH box helicase [Saccharopolyspora oryzae]MDA3628352.1 DEAD/DEAH box helicase family protein [Saccharopolyspora oryzae]
MTDHQGTHMLKPFDMDLLNRAVEEMDPADRDAELVAADRIAVGHAAESLGAEYFSRGDLDAAHRWYGLAVDCGVPNAPETLADIAMLREAIEAPEIRCAAANTSLAPLSGGVDTEQIPVADEISNAASIVRAAKDAAARIIDDAHARADRIVADARDSREAARETSRSIADLLDHGWSSGQVDAGTRSGLLLCAASTGSGKTNTIMNLIDKLARDGRRTLLVAPTKAAAEQVARHLARRSPFFRDAESIFDTDDWSRAEISLASELVQCVGRLNRGGDPRIGSAMSADYRQPVVPTLTASACDASACFTAEFASSFRVLARDIGPDTELLQWKSVQSRAVSYWRRLLEVSAVLSAADIRGKACPHWRQVLGDVGWSVQADAEHDVEWLKLLRTELNEGSSLVEVAERLLHLLDSAGKMRMDPEARRDQLTPGPELIRALDQLDPVGNRSDVLAR